MQVPHPKVTYTQGFLSQVWEQSLAKPPSGDKARPATLLLQVLLPSMAPEALVPGDRCSGQSEGSLGHTEAWTLKGGRVCRRVSLNLLMDIS